MEARFRKPLEGIFILALFWLAERYRSNAENRVVQIADVDSIGVQMLRN
jgi:hypothetical protein